jgi:hypothetical protein
MINLTVAVILPDKVKLDDIAHKNTITCLFL